MKRKKKLFTSIKDNRLLIERIMKFIWWVFLTSVIFVYLLENVKKFNNSEESKLDIVLLLVFIVLILKPFIQEIDIFGFKIKKEISEIKNELEFSKLEFKNQMLDIKQQFTNTITIYNNQPLPSKEEADSIKNEYVGNVSNRFLADMDSFNISDVDDDVLFCFKVRYKLEKIINEIFVSKKISVKPLIYNQFDHFSDKKLATLEKLRIICSKQMIDESICGSFVETWKICNAVIHGEPVSNFHIEFVKDVSSKLLEDLEKIKKQK